MIYCFDIDGTLCTKTNGDYASAEPFRDRIAVVNALYAAGHMIKLFTSRGLTTGIDWREVTARQMQAWDVRYHMLIMGKPEADIFIDDKAFNADHWHWERDRRHADSPSVPADADHPSEDSLAPRSRTK